MGERNRQADPRTNILLEAALEYAAHGVAVLPLHSVDGRGGCTCGRGECGSAGKHPVSGLVEHGHSNATTDETTIREWWACMPNANVGGVPGLGGFCILDCDPWKAGERERIAALVAQHGELPETLVVHSGAHEVEGETIRGEHRWYRLPGGVRFTKHAVSGIEVKAEGGYVVMPPSVHPSGVRYEVAHGSLDDVALAPRWMVEGAQSLHSPVAADPARLTGVPIGIRTRRAIEDGYLPPPEDNQSHRDVAVGIARNLRESGTPKDLAHLLMGRLLVDPGSWLDEGRPWTTGDAERIVASVFSGPAPDHAERVRRDESRLRLRTLAEAFVEAQREVDWVVPDLLAAGEKAVIAGPPKSLKTWLALHLVRCVTVGEIMLNEPAWRVSEPQPVLCIQEEGSAQRWAQRLAMVFEGVRDASLFYTHRASFSLLSQAHVDWVIENARNVGARLIVIDPWQRV